MSAPALALLRAMRAAGLPRPTLEHRFHPTRRWRLDIAYPSHKLGIEVEGGNFARAGAKRCPQCRQTPQGRHNTGQGMEADCEKYSWAAALGWRLIRVTPGMIQRGLALELICVALGRVPQSAHTPP
jgi:hypothetical protein